jgi:DNA-binding response OmpR family regulator
MSTSAGHRGDRPVPHHHPRLLLAHGDPSLRDGLVGILRRAGYDVEFASNFDEAFAILNKADVDTLVVNSQLPPNGCGALLERCHGPLPTIVLGESTDDVEGLTADRRVKAVLMRPFQLQALYDAVARTTN